MENSEDYKNILQNFNTKERSVNFSREEVLKLQRLVDKYKHILMCKKTDGTSAKQKEQAWSKIEMEFNSTGVIPRALKQLKYKFENLKRSAKKEAIKECQEIIRTGGGKPPSLPPVSEEGVDWLRSVMSASIDGNDSIYDDDIIAPNSVTIKNVDSNIIVVNVDDKEMLPTQKVNEIEKEISGSVFDCSTPHSSLKKPMSAPLKRQISQKKAGSSDDNLIKRALREQKISVLKDLNNMEINKIKRNIEQQEELHQQIIRQNEEKHKLELIKLELEIEILKKRMKKTASSMSEENE